MKTRNYCGKSFNERPPLRVYYFATPAASGHTFWEIHGNQQNRRTRLSLPPNCNRLANGVLVDPTSKFLQRGRNKWIPLGVVLPFRDSSSDDMPSNKMLKAVGRLNRPD